MKPIKLFGFAGSTYVRTARLVCAEKDVPCELLPLEFRAESHRARHPFMKMPAMEHDGVQLFETLAIATYVDALSPQPILRPRDARQEAMMMTWISASIDYLYRDLVSALLEDELAKGVEVPIARDLDALDAALANQRYLAGDSVSLADLFVLPMVDFAAKSDAAFGAGARRNLTKWLKTMSARPSFAATAG